MPRRFVLHVNTSGYACEVFLNGVPIVYFNDAGGLIAKPVSHHVVRGVNRVAMVIGADERPNGHRDPDLLLQAGEPVHLEVSVSEDNGGGMEDTSSRILFTWRWSRQAGEAFPLISGDEGTFVVDNWFDRWCWHHADNLEKEEFRPAVLAMLVSLSSSLQQRDPEPFIEKASPRFEDMAKAYGFDPNQRRALVRDNLAAAIAADPTLRIEAVNAAEADLRLVGGGRLIECNDVHREPLLRTPVDADGARALMFPVMVSRFRNEYLIVR